MAVPRTDVEHSLHRLANYVECELVDIFRQLLIDSRLSAVSSVACSARDFIEALREARDGKAGE